MRQAYRVQGVPMNGTMAFCPVPSASPEAATNGVNLIVGAPGTVRIPAPRARTTAGPFSNASPGIQNPDWIMPSIYSVIPSRANNPFVRQGSGVQSPHTVAVPVGQIQALVGNWMRRARIGGRVVTRAVRPFTQWPTYGGGTQ